ARWCEKTTGAGGLTVASAAGFPGAGTYFVRTVDAAPNTANQEVMQVAGGQGTTPWNVARGQLGPAPAKSHLAGVTVSALATDWFATFSGVAAGSQNLKVTYQGQSCAA